MVHFAVYPILFGLILGVLSLPTLAAEYTGKITAISDGDTLTLLIPDGASYRQLKVRLGEIDTPETAQPYGTRAKQQLSDLAFGRQARVVVQDTDRYGRTVGRVYVGGFDVNAEMVKRGAAWVYRAYAKDQSLYRLEAEAKAAKQGLWALPETDRCEPWNWRKKSCAVSTSVAQPPPSTPTGFNNARSVGTFTCSLVKKRCAEMTSCEEARFYLQTCGVQSLDGNHDGEPCEKLCIASHQR